jgi:hypothetical protein
MKKVLILLVLVMNFGCSTKAKIIDSITCKENISLQYDKINSREKQYVIKAKKLNAFIVYFLSEFDDDIQGFVNNELKYEKHLKLDGSSDELKEYFGYNYSKDKTLPILKIVSKTKKTCFDIKIDKKYKIVYVYISKEGKWTVRFSNTYYAR